MKKFLLVILLHPIWAFAQEFDSARVLTYLKHLSSSGMEGRKTDSPGGRRAAEYIAAEFKKAEIEPMGGSYFQPFEFKDNKTHQIYVSRNVVGFIKGRRNTDKYILLSAHYDHLGSQGDTIFFGADDNASGVALLLELANFFSKHKPENSIIFVAFDAEEFGLKGSEHFVSHPPVALKSIEVNLNFDMIARSESKTIFIAGTKPYPQLRPIADFVIKANSESCQFKIGYDGTFPNQKNWTQSSDHYHFHKKNVPFLYFGVEDHKDYHTPSDRFDKINPAFYFKACKRIVDALVWYDAYLK